MQGDLQETDIFSIIKFLEWRQQTGTLYVETTYQPVKLNRSSRYNYESFNSESYLSSSSYQPKGWLIFFRDGKIVYAVDSQRNDTIRLKDYLSWESSEEIMDCVDETGLVSSNLVEYYCLVRLLQKYLITPVKAKKIVKSILEETILQALSLYQGRFVFKSSQIHLSNFAEFSASSLFMVVSKELQSWYKLTPYIYSESQCFSQYSQEQLKKSLSPDTYQKLANWSEQKASLLQASRQLNCSLVTLAKAVYPYVKKSWIKLLADDQQDDLKQSANKKQNKPHIIYIDNDVTNGKNVEYILKQRSYQLTVVQDSIEALSIILKTQPDAILCNVDMPQLSGYELCSMLQNSQIGRQIPIILMAEREDFLALTKAKVVCAGNYLTKPFVNNELLMLLEKHLKVMYRQNRMQAVNYTE